MSSFSASIFVDAGLPQPNATRLDLMQREDPAEAANFAEYLRQGASAAILQQCSQAL